MLTQDEDGTIHYAGLPEAAKKTLFAKPTASLQEKIDRLEQELWEARNELAALGNTAGEREAFEREAKRHGNDVQRMGDTYPGRHGAEWYWWKLAWRSAMGYKVSATLPEPAETGHAKQDNCGKESDANPHG